jgi:hypothetical protein
VKIYVAASKLEALRKKERQDETFDYSLEQALR